MTLPPNKTKIVCTIGPASESPEVLEHMIRRGMNIARINFSHGNFPGHESAIENIRAAAATVGERIAIMADLPGPKMRIGRLRKEPLELRPGDAFTLTTEEGLGDEERVSVSLARLPQVVEPGDRLFVNDGLVELRVVATEKIAVRCEVKVGGEILSRKGLNLPGINLGMSAFTERDRECLEFSAKRGIDAVSLSFVETGADIGAVRHAAEALDYDPFIIAKIERAGALDHMEDILQAADGIMIARGDLGVEIPISQIAIVQKHLMEQANKMGKPLPSVSNNFSVSIKGSLTTSLSLHV
jgi:pyruvate kinase